MTEPFSFPFSVPKALVVQPVPNAMLRQLRLQPKHLINARFLSIRCLSSSSSSPPPPQLDPASANDPPPDSAVDGRSAPPPPSIPSYFSDIKDRLKSPQSHPRRIPINPPPPSAFSAPSRPASDTSFEEVRKHLAEFRLKSGGLSSGKPPPSDFALPFQDRFNNKASGIHRASSERTVPPSLDAIRESLKKFRDSPGGIEGPARSSGFNIKAFQDGLRKGPQLIGTDKLPDSIFGRERRDKKGEGNEEEPKVRRTEFVKMYSYEELGHKLQKLRPEEDEKNVKCFSLAELNERLAKLRELEEKEMESHLGGLSFRDIRESLERLKHADAKKKENMNRLSFFANLASPGTPAFMLKPPQENLLENYSHPDHLSSAENLKLELKKVRDEFKTSENDCGSAEVQVAQLTTKIKHLSAVLHKKDKHSRKGLHEMIQLRKKLLKYLRRTDWDSYCIVLAKLGLRDVPDYKIASYKT